MCAAKNNPPILHVQTPLTPSTTLSNLLGRQVFLKLENTQPSGSFKIRGIGRTCQSQVAKGANRLIGASGGNAGLALAYSAKVIGVPCTVYIPESTPKFMVEKLRAEGADARVFGKDFDAATTEAIRISKEHKHVGYVHSYNQPTTWEGNSTIVDEIKEQLETNYDIHCPPCSITTAVGGGGLALGILKGLHRVGWKDVPLLAMESYGTESFHLSVKAKKQIKLEEITSICTSIGCKTVLPQLLDIVFKKRHRVLSRVVTDQEALQACIRFAEDHRMLVEPACGTVLSAAYKNRIVLQACAKNRDKDCGPVVLIICGGNIASFQLYEEWQNKLGF